MTQLLKYPRSIQNFNDTCRVQTLLLTNIHTPPQLPPSSSLSQATASYSSPGTSTNYLSFQSIGELYIFKEDNMELNLLGQFPISQSNMSDLPSVPLPFVMFLLFHILYYFRPHCPLLHLTLPLLSFLYIFLSSPQPPSPGNVCVYPPISIFLSLVSSAVSTLVTPARMLLRHLHSPTLINCVFMTAISEDRLGRKNMKCRNKCLEWML